MMSINNKSFELIVGTNEEFLLGYYISPKADGSLELNASFSNHSHTGRVKQVAISDQFLISGSTDEHLRLFNLNSRKELGNLLPHEGTITCLEYHKSGFFFSAAEDGKIVIFKKGKWEIEKELVGHDCPVNSLAVHPSGKLALSVCRKKRMITWDLVKGKRAYMSGLKKVGEIIKWSPSGQHYIITSGVDLDIYEVETGNISKTFTFKVNINCLLFLSNELLAVGVEGGYIYVYNIVTHNEILSWEAHSNRIKSLVSLENTEEVHLISSASSDGYIKVWSINISVSPSKKLETMIDTKCRIICMSTRNFPSNMYDNSEDVEKFEEEFQQRQDDYRYQQKQRKLKYRKKFKNSEAVPKAKVVVINGGQPIIKDQTSKIQNDHQKWFKKKKINKGSRSNDDITLKKVGTVHDRLNFKNNKATNKTVNKKSNNDLVNKKKSSKIANKLKGPLAGTIKNNKIGVISSPNTSKFKKGVPKIGTPGSLKKGKKTLKRKKKIT